MFYNPYTGGSFGEFDVPNPTVPVDQEIPGGFQPGQRVIIRGYCPGHCQDFRVDFVTYSGHIAFHISPRFYQNTVVRNTDRGGWGSEERSGPFPFRHSEPFDLVVTANSDYYSVSVNGNHVFDYNHRVPLNEVTRLAVTGDVECQAITFQGGSQSRVNEVHGLSVPSSVPLVGGCFAGKLIQIQGYVPNHAGRFEVNLQAGPNHQPDNIALHFNPRWNDPHQPHQPIVVRTHRHYGSWGPEERDGHSPFQKGAGFEILILNDNNEWKVAVNGQHYVSFPMHFECGMVDFVAFDGDVEISSVRQFN